MISFEKIFKIVSRKFAIQCKKKSFRPLVTRTFGGFNFDRHEGSVVFTRHLKPRPHPTGGYLGHSLLLSVKCDESPVLWENIQSKLPRPLNIKRKSSNRLYTFFNDWTFHMIPPLKSRLHIFPFLFVFFLFLRSIEK